MVYSQEDRRKPFMVFSSGHFNVSSVVEGDRIVLVVQVFDIVKRNLVMLKFLITFDSDDVAKSFHRYVTEGSSCTNSMIPVDISDRLALLHE